MYERMLNKQVVPTEEVIKKYIEGKAVENIEKTKNGLEKIFELKMELKFPFGNGYGWGYKVSNKTKHMFYLFFEKGDITIMLQINKIKTEKEIENIIIYLMKVRNTGEIDTHVEEMGDGYIIE